MLRQPRQHFAGIGIRRKDRIAHLLDPSVANDERQSLDQRHAFHVKRGQSKRSGQRERVVAQQFKGQMQSRNGLLLIRGVLRGKPLFGESSR